MKISDLKQGMKFKPLSDPSIHGVCLSITDNLFTYRWINAEGKEEVVINNMKLKEAVDCFNLYGWKVLSDLEAELI
jgi:hypothetical protein